MTIFRSNSNRKTGVSSPKPPSNIPKQANNIHKSEKKSIVPNRWNCEKHFAIFRHPDYKCSRGRCHYCNKEIRYQPAIDAAKHVAICQNLPQDVCRPKVPAARSTSLPLKSRNLGDAFMKRFEFFRDPAYKNPRARCTFCGSTINHLCQVYRTTLQSVKVSRKYDTPSSTLDSVYVLPCFDLSKQVRQACRGLSE